ncbi:MAG: M48 family metallopeptidase [Candidatus Levybacteria bacterium]|nr:M48 family metallopeptidase [Candidatus Levybacteria bacterium]
MVESPKISIVRSHRRTISVHIEPDGDVIVKAPKLMPTFMINNFISSHQDWIDKHLARIKKVPVVKRAKDQYLYLGQMLTLEPSSVTKISVKNDTLFFPQSLMFRKDKELLNWYLSESKRVITLQTEKYALEMKTEFKEITFSDTKSQWGRCTQDNRLQFNWRLIMAPAMVLNYVVVHELAHTIEKNHTQMFWMKVRGITPSYRQQIKWLKDYGATLKIK